MSIVIDPNETALLVIDMQNGMCHPNGTLALGGVDMLPFQDIVPRVRRLIELCREHTIPDIWSRQIHYPRDRARDAHKILPHTLRRPRIACQAGSWDAEIIDDLKDVITPQTEIIDKHKFSCFYGTRLEPLLRILGARLLIVCGTTTNLCVDATIRDAYMRDYDVVVVRDAVAGVDPAWHETALAIYARYMAEVMTLNELASMIRPRVEARP